MKLTMGDVAMLRYFIKEKGDVTRWCHWEAKKAQVQAEYPQLIAALNDVERAERVLASVVDALPLDY